MVCTDLKSKVKPGTASHLAGGTGDVILSPFSSPLRPNLESQQILWLSRNFHNSKKSHFTDC